MTSDLLFSILPREGKVPIAHDSQKVEQIDKGEEREARKKQQQQKKNERSPEQESTPEQVEQKDIDTDQKKPKGPKHLDIYV